ncbi:MULTISPECIES: nucleotide-binding protein [unclassified Marinovum]
MEKRWTRKKRAARDAGGPEPKPALSGGIRMSGQDMPIANLRPNAETTASDGPTPDAAPKPKVQRRVTDPETPKPEAVPEVKQRTKDLKPRPAPKPETAPKPLAQPPVAAPETPEPEVHQHKAKPQPAPAPVSTPTPAPVAKAAEAAERETPQPDTPMPAPAVSKMLDNAWTRLDSFPINARKLERNRVITATREDPAHSAFDVLRTKLLRALRDNGWTRVAVTSPTEGCGKTFMCANLALSLSRQSNCRSVVLDLDLRHPSLHKALNITDPPNLPAFLRGKLPIEDVFRRPADNLDNIGANVAFGVNGQREPYAAELLQDTSTAAVLNAMEKAFDPDVILFDMPPALVNDDVLAARGLFDGIILVVGGGITKPQQVRDVERRMGTETPLLGVVLNRAEGENAEIYGY